MCGTATFSRHKSNKNHKSCASWYRNRESKLHQNEINLISCDCLHFTLNMHARVVRDKFVERNFARIFGDQEKICLKLNGMKKKYQIYCPNWILTSSWWSTLMPCITNDKDSINSRWIWFQKWILWCLKRY